MPSDIEEAAKMAMGAAAAGGSMRVLMAVHGGMRGWILLIEAAIGAMLGLIAAGGAVWWDPSLRAIGWPLLIVSAAAGCAGAVGTRLLDLLIAEAERRLRARG